MVLKSSFNQFNEFFIYITNQLRKIYLHSSIYNKKISKIDNRILQYTPSPSLLNCLINIDPKTKAKIYAMLYQRISINPKEITTGSIEG